jgi:hypothetical protein
MMLPVNNNAYLSSDLDDDRRYKQERESAAEQALAAVGNLLDSADGILGDLEDNDMLGSAIVRRCQELADVIGGLANELDQQSDEDRRALAQACLQDASDLQLENESQPLELRQFSTEITSMSEDDMVRALSGVTSLLHDVEASFRSISKDEAEDIADVALTLARLFLASLKDLFSTMTPEELAGTHQSRSLSESGVHVELLDDDGQAQIETEKPTRKKETKGRVRVLWPPLGPAVKSACQWGKDEAEKKPLLAVALAITLWPCAVVTAVMGAPLVLADGLLQNAYNSFSDGPLVENLERGAAQLYHAGRLSFLCGGLMCRQTLRVASRQIDRRGGVGKVAQDIGDLALYRALHPVETFGMTWDGVTRGLGAIRDVIAAVQEVSQHASMANLE